MNGRRHRREAFVRSQRSGSELFVTFELNHRSAPPRRQLDLLKAGRTDQAGLFAAAHPT